MLFITNFTSSASGRKMAPVCVVLRFFTGYTGWSTPIFFTVGSFSCARRAWQTAELAPTMQTFLASRLPFGSVLTQFQHLGADIGDLSAVASEQGSGNRGKYQPTDGPGPLHGCGAPRRPARASSSASAAAPGPGRSDRLLAPPRAPPAREGAPRPARPDRAPRAPEVSQHLRAPRRGSPRPSRGRGAGGSPAGERPGQGETGGRRRAGRRERSGSGAQTGIPRAEAFPRAAGGRGFR